MNSKKFTEAMSEINNKYVDEAISYKKKAKKPAWLKWGAMAACLCLVVGLAIPMLNNRTSEPHQEELPPVAEELPPVFDEGPAGTMPEIDIIEFNGVEYFVCSNDDKAILQECGIITELTKDLAGNHVCYLGISDNRFVPTEKADASEENDIELFEYAPEPNENVYIMCRSGEYFAAIRMDSEGYHGLDN